MADAARDNTDRYAIADVGANRIFNKVGFLAATEHLGKLLATASTFFMATSATPMFNLDVGKFAVQIADNRLDCGLLSDHAHQRLSAAVSNKGRNFPATASRARKILERTVPIGQSMMEAISS